MYTFAKIVNQSANEKKAPSEKKNEVPENKEAAEKPPVTKEEENKKDEKKSDSAEKKKKNIGSKESGENKKTNIGEAVCNDEERKERWLIYASSVLDTNMITTEFASVAGYIPSSISRTEWLKNMRDNRFMDIVCMDHSRVILHTGGYIHASWITISDDKKAIATQLPLPHTASRFWRMILENGVKGVLLLITEEEYKQMGGEFTFPASQDFLYFKEGSLRVGEFQRVTIKNNWTMRVISVTNGNKKSFIHLHHLSSWPHGKTPSDLIDLWQVQSVMRKYSGPHVYVSLSGCGRAGTFATFEVAHASLHKERLTSFSVEESLKQVRAGRLHAVQNAAQYSSVHSLLAEHILNNGVSKLVTCRGSENPEENVRKLIDSLVLPLADDQDGVAG
ncbi:unnamed protein product [Caenorhabditis auriculariae]|uniref:Tyrosine-protein phosphatase domain-containing protein n=1 Tax=Caenorhabditis auriculariae TaxID=2777116 RepID=A0A8S1HFZ4_9PELO|nr:unnamed protein product [Caenorhabditis auriculariae]